MERLTFSHKLNVVTLVGGGGGGGGGGLAMGAYTKSFNSVSWETEDPWEDSLLKEDLRQHR